MSRSNRSAWLICAAIALAGCAVNDRSNESAVDRRGEECLVRMNDLSELFQYGDYIRALTADALQNEYARMEDVFSRRDTPARRIKLALLLSLPDTSFRNDARARELLQKFPLLANGDESYQRFAALYLRMLNDRRALEQALDGERKQHQVLRKQVEELKAIEQHIIQRDQSVEREVKP